MQSDRYLKAVLTVIAACLVWICLRDVPFVKTATASGGITDVNIVALDGQEFHVIGAVLPVKVDNWPSSLK